MGLQCRGQLVEAQGREDEELGRSQLAEQLGGVSVRRASREHAELLVNPDLQAIEVSMQMQIIRNWEQTKLESG
jgi:hypothetical protein